MALLLHKHICLLKARSVSSRFDAEANPRKGQTKTQQDDAITVKQGRRRHLSGYKALALEQEHTYINTHLSSEAQPSGDGKRALLPTALCQSQSLIHSGIKTHAHTRFLFFFFCSTPSLTLCPRGGGRSSYTTSVTTPT